MILVTINFTLILKKGCNTAATSRALHWQMQALPSQPSWTEAKWQDILHVSAWQGWGVPGKEVPPWPPRAPEFEVRYGCCYPGYPGVKRDPAQLPLQAPWLQGLTCPPGRQGSRISPASRPTPNLAKLTIFLLFADHLSVPKTSSRSIYLHKKSNLGIVIDI